MYFREGASYRIHFGPMKGLKLYYDRSVNYHAIVGLWDAEEYEFLGGLLDRGEYLPPGAIVADVGANLGLFSLWMSRRLQRLSGRVFAFEPAPATLRKLEANVRLNEASLVEIVPIACSDRSGTIPFFVGHHHHVSSLYRDWAHAAAGVDATTVEVPTLTLDEFYRSRDVAYPEFIKMDIEGGAVLALKGCREAIAVKRPLMWIESHRPDEDRAISDVLVEQDYCAYRFTNRRLVTKPRDTHPDPDGVWGTLLLYPHEQRRRVEALL
jgi:FkbM family methyltransferase